MTSLSVSYEIIVIDEMYTVYKMVSQAERDTFYFKKSITFTYDGMLRIRMKTLDYNWRMSIQHNCFECFESFMEDSILQSQGIYQFGDRLSAIYNFAL